MPRLETLLLSIGGSQPAAHRQPVCAPQRFVQRQTHGGCESIKASGIILPRAGALGFSASCASVPNAARHRRGGEEDALAPAPRRSVCQGSDSTPGLPLPTNTQGLHAVGRGAAVAAAVARNRVVRTSSHAEVAIGDVCAVEVRGGGGIQTVGYEAAHFPLEGGCVDV